MTDQELKVHNSKKLGECHPIFRRKVHAILDDMRLYGYRVRVQEAYRSKEAQWEAYRKGYSKVLFGFHNTTDKDGNPDALAVDLVDDNNPYKEPKPFFLVLYSSAVSHGLTTGVLFGLSERDKVRIKRVVEERRFGEDVPIGWDGWHVQPAKMTIEEARSGIRRF